MSTILLQLEKRTAEVDKLAEEIQALASRMAEGHNVQPELSIKGQQWYRGARELLVQHNYSGLEDFDACYKSYPNHRFPETRAHSDIENYITADKPAATDSLVLFNRYLTKARSLLLALKEELLSRELPVKTELSLAISATEFERAQELFDVAKGDEVLIRASGVIARVALERHLFTVAETRSIPITVNPPSKRKPEVEDVATTLVKAHVITPVQKSQLDFLFKVANHCAHPKEAVVPANVEKLIRDGHELASVIL